MTRHLLFHSSHLSACLSSPSTTGFSLTRLFLPLLQRRMRCFRQCGDWMNGKCQNKESDGYLLYMH